MQPHANSAAHSMYGNIQCILAAAAGKDSPEEEDLAIAPFPPVLVKDCPLPDVDADADEPPDMPTT